MSEITKIRARSPDPGDRVLLAEGDAGARRWLREAIGGRFGVDEVDRGDVALELLTTGAPRLVVVGTQLADMTGGDLLARAAARLGDRGAPISTFLLADAGGAVADVDEAQVKVYYRLVPTMQAARVVDLLAQAAARLPPRPP
ncbi:MAG: hypothetical protein KF773_40835, partial [Deltaproteobacteria bacterium]|nr:hypothetical protein [Deltaproteobacteria bacterium]